MNRPADVRAAHEAVALHLRIGIGKRAQVNMAPIPERGDRGNGRRLNGAPGAINRAPTD